MFKNDHKYNFKNNKGGWITSKSKLSFEGMTLRLNTSDSTFKERTTEVDHFKVKTQLWSKDSKTLNFWEHLQSLTQLWRKEPQKWITSKSKLRLEGKNISLYTSDHISSSWLKFESKYYHRILRKMVTIVNSTLLRTSPSLE